MAQINNARLADRILLALTLSLSQKDVAISELLARALEMSVTRGAGGKDFVERRQLDDEVNDAFTELNALRKSAKS